MILLIIGCINSDLELKDTGDQDTAVASAVEPSDDQDAQEDVNQPSAEAEPSSEEQTTDSGEQEETDPTDVNEAGESGTYNALSGPASVPSTGSDGTAEIISLPMPSGIITDVNIMIDLDHTCTKDLLATLTSPSNTTVVLFDLAYMPVCSSNLENTIFDDEASVNIQQGSSPFTGAHQSLENLFHFDGEDAAGEWTLMIIDSQIGDSGALKAWEMEFTF